MRKKQIDLFGNPVSNEKVIQGIEQIKRKKTETIITEKLLEPILAIVTEERHFLTWPVDTMVSKITGIKSVVKDKLKTQNFESIFTTLKELKQCQKFEGFRGIFIKIFRNYEDLYIFFLKDSSNSLTQFLRIFSFMQFIMELIESVESSNTT